MFEDDGCTWFPDGTWAACCDVHDQAFATGTTAAEFLRANVELLGCIAQYDPIAALLAFIGVMTGGALFFFFGRKKRV